MRKSSSLQKEFLHMDGYSMLVKVFESCTDYGTDEGRVFLSDCFSIVNALAVDGDAENIVGNIDALGVLFR